MLLAWSRFLFRYKSSPFDETRLRDQLLLSMKINDEKHSFYSAKGHFPTF